MRQRRSHFAGRRQAQRLAQFAGHLAQLVDHDTDKEADQRQHRIEQLQFVDGDISRAAPFDQRHDAGLQHEHDQRRAIQAVARGGPDHRQEQQIQILEFGIGERAEHRVQHPHQQADVAQRLRSPHGLAQAAPALRAGQHPDQRHRHQHPDHVADAKAQHGQAPVGRRDQAGQQQQADIAHVVDQHAQRHDGDPLEQPRAVIENIAAAEVAPQRLADQAVADGQPQRTQHGHQRSGRHAAHQQLAAQQRQEPRQRRAPAVAQPEHQAQRRVGIPRRDVQAIQGIDIARPVA